MSPSPELRDALTARPAMPRAVAGLIIGVIHAASLAPLVWPLLPFNAPGAPLP